MPMIDRLALPLLEYAKAVFVLLFVSMCDISVDMCCPFHRSCVHALCTVFPEIKLVPTVLVL